VPYFDNHTYCYITIIHSLKKLKFGLLVNFVLGFLYFLRYVNYLSCYFREEVDAAS
jgi:hypothetical protein